MRLFPKSIEYTSNLGFEELDRTIKTMLKETTKNNSLRFIGYFDEGAFMVHDMNHGYLSTSPMIVGNCEQKSDGTKVHIRLKTSFSVKLTALMSSVLCFGLLMFTFYRFGSYSVIHSSLIALMVTAIWLFIYAIVVNRSAKLSIQRLVNELSLKTV